MGLHSAVTLQNPNDATAFMSALTFAGATPGAVGVLLGQFTIPKTASIWGTLNVQVMPMPTFSAILLVVRSRLSTRIESEQK